MVLIDDAEVKVCENRPVLVVFGRRAWPGETGDSLQEMLDMSMNVYITRWWFQIFFIFTPT